MFLIITEYNGVVNLNNKSTLDIHEERLKQERILKKKFISI